MASPDPELRDGLTLPVWMKTKPTKDFEPFARSPPAHEDSFFYVKYPKSDILFGKPKIAEESPNFVASADYSNGINTAASYNIKDKDWSKHTKPCQDVLHGIAPINTALNSTKPKPAGIDDGFKGEGAACGNSIVKVAQDMISSTRPPRGFTVASPVDSDDQQPDPQHYRLASRRGSKSLPTTPAHSPNSSPTSRRRRNGNRYFASAFEPVDDGSNRSWLSMALLGFKKDLTTSTSTLAEEDSLEVRLNGGTLMESVENLGPAPKNKDATTLSNDISTSQATKPTKMSHAFRPRPSELREMNFWSPTSM